MDDRVKVRRLRHWKQRYNKNAAFVWSKRKIWAGKEYLPGDPIPDDLANNKAKLKRFWESNVLQLAEFTSPNVVTGQRPTVAKATSDDLPEGVTVEQGKGNWFIVKCEALDIDNKVNGRKALDGLLSDIREDLAAAAAEDDTDSPKEDDNSWLDDFKDESGEGESSDE